MIAWMTQAALAGGYYYADSGIIANGRGGANVASADDQFAQYYNPAGLVRVDRPTVNIGLSGVAQAIAFAPYDAGTDTLGEPVRNEGGLFAVPELGFVTPLGPDFTFALGFTSGFAPAYQFPEGGAQRYTIIDTTIWSFQVGPTVAWRPVRWLALAVGPQWQALRVDERLKVTITGTTDPKGDVAVDARTWDKLTPSANFGLLVEPRRELSFGAMVQPSTRFHARGVGELDFTGNALEDHLDQVVWTDDDIGLAIALPTFVRTGVAVRPRHDVEIEASFVYETWSKLQDIVVSDVNVQVTGLNGLIDSPVEETIELPAGFQDTWSVRLGGEWAASDRVDVRLGGFYEAPSLAADSVSVALVDTPKWMVGGGGTAHVLDDHLLIDAFVSRVQYQEMQIRDSTVHQINVYGGEEAIVGNGDLSSRGLAAGAALRWQIGDATRLRDEFGGGGRGVGQDSRADRERLSRQRQDHPRGGVAR